MLLKYIRVVAVIMNFFRCFLIVIIVLLLSVSGSFGYLVYTIGEMEQLPEPSPPLTTRIYDCRDELMAVRYEENRVEVPLEQVSEHLIKATLAVEDRRFYRHHGFDPAGLTRALLNNIKGGQTSQGGSTITQQLAKNLYLSHERTLERKVKEALYTIHLERRYHKDEILEMYLNTIYYGHAAYGIEAAAQTYFGKSAADLSLGEAALLAGLPKGPAYYSPLLNPEAAEQRQRTVLSQMADAGFIDESEKEAALREELVFREHTFEESSAYFLDYVINTELAEFFNGDLDPVYRGGLNIYTTIDQEMQQLAQEIIAGISPFSLDENGIRQPQGALVAIEPDTGYVRAMVGGRDFRETSLNRALALRSPGSAFKPFVYAAALENGFTAIDQVRCEATSFIEEGIDEPYAPTDVGRGFHNRELTIREALAKSCNIVAIKVHDQIGKEKAVEMARRLGISSHLGPYFSLPLGTKEVTLLELTAAFAPFANGGFRVKPLFIRKVVDSQGIVLLENEPQKGQVLDPAVAFLVTDMLKDVLTEGGTAGGASSILNRPAAGKSGTSQGSKNAHMVGYTPQLLAGIYIGDDYEKPIEFSGGGHAAPLWAWFMERALKDAPVLDFKIPDGITSRTLCPVSGLPLGPYCPEPGRAEYFIKGTEPAEECRLCRPPFWWPWLPSIKYSPSFP
jgi:1A family penicillin-binding protein